MEPLEQIPPAPEMREWNNLLSFYTYWYFYYYCCCFQNTVQLTEISVPKRLSPNLSPWTCSKMAIKDHLPGPSTNDARASDLSPNDHYSNIAAAKLAKLAAEKAKKEAADKLAAEAKRKADQDAKDLANCREQIASLTTQLQEAKRLVETTGARERSTKDELEREARTRADELAKAKAEVQRLNTVTSSMVSDYHKLDGELDQVRATLQATTSERDHYRHELNCGDDIAVHRISWGGRDLTDNGNVVNRVRERVRNGWNIQYNNDFFDCDPQHGTRKYGIVVFNRRGQRVLKCAAWEGEERGTQP